MKIEKYYKIFILLAVCCVFLCSSWLLSQTKETTTPLELPAFIIEGVEQLNVKSGMKQAAARPPVLDAKELDSLNTYDKQTPALLAFDKLPEHFVTSEYYRGFASASYGIYNTPKVDVGYDFYVDNFDIFAQAGFAYSGGDAKNSNYNKIYLDVNSDYIADDKFFIFGGSRTKTGFVLSTQNYNFYGNDISKYPDKNYYDRNLTKFKFDVVSDGAYESVLFNVGGTLNLLKTSNDAQAVKYTTGSGINNNYVRGFLEVKNYWQNFLVGGNIFLDFESAAGNTVNFYQADASASYFDNKFSILARAGFQVANNSDGIDRGGLLLSGDLEYRINKLLTLKAGISSGLEKTNLDEMLELNPYLSSRAHIDYAYNIANIKGAVWFHPTEKFLFTSGINLKFANRLMYFVLDTLAEYKLSYEDGTIFEIFGELFCNISEFDRFVAKLNFNINKLDNSKNLTYLPPVKFSGTYYHKWFNALGTAVTGEYIGWRHISDINNSILSGYLLLNLSADYKYNDFIFSLVLNNITNSDVYVWDKYRERGIFASFGLMWQF